jgi:hypothetical protein
MAGKLPHNRSAMKQLLAEANVESSSSSSEA